MSATQILHLISGPVIGAVIGIFTNYIAVRMLFRPLREIRLFGWRLPFTPGIIPRRQKALARALGHAVSDELVREEDLAKILASDTVSDTVAGAILAVPTLGAAGEALAGEAYPRKREEVLDLLTDRVAAGIAAVDLGAVLSAEAKNAVGGIAARNPLVGMFVNDAMIESLTAPIADKVRDYLAAEGHDKLRAALAAQLAETEERPLADLLAGAGLDRAALAALFRRLVAPLAATLAAQFRVAETVEEKINAMPPEELEALVLSVMRRELNAVVLLGGVIGFLLGLVSVVFDFL